jgi:ferredoxin
MEVEVKFERENISGVIPIGSYLFDAARRLGVEVDCERRGESDLCAMRIMQGGEFLSETTKAEREHLTSKRRKNGERLACQAKFEQVGEVVIMTTEKKEEEKPADEAKYEAYRKEFEELPLEKKIADLLHFEAIAFSETISFVLNSPSMIVGKLMDVMAEFGLKMEDDAKKATRPEEHNGGGKAEDNGHSEVKAEENGHHENTETSQTTNEPKEET